jgi:hypothetical protein
MTNAEYVLIKGKTFLYKQKAPFVPSGVSVQGALEYDEATDKVKCHECGEWHLALGKHLSWRHGMKALDYRKKHGLVNKASLCGLRNHAKRSESMQKIDKSKFMAAGVAVRKKALANAHKVLSENGKSGHFENRNIKGTCQAQILETLQELHKKLGRTPSEKDMYDHNLSKGSVLLSLNTKTIGAAMSLAGMLPNKRGSVFAPGLEAAKKKNTKYTKPLLVELVRDFYTKHGRIPSVADADMGLIPQQCNFIYHFGSMRAVYEAAGLAKVADESRKKIKAQTADNARLSRWPGHSVVTEAQHARA